MLMLTEPARPKFELVYRGVDITSELWPHLVSCTYTDKVHGEADEIEVEVQDKDGLWRGPWCPEHGDQVGLSIGYEPGLLVPAGSFEIDEPNAKLGRGGDTFSFRGMSAPVSKSLRTQKTRAYEQQGLKDIASRIASAHGLVVVGSPPDVRFDRVTQRRERDLAFLSRLADAFGAYFSVRGGQLVFARREELHERAPSLLIRADSDDYISAELKRAAHKTYSKARATYFEGNDKKRIDVEVEDPAVKTGDTLRIDERVENEGQARMRARSELQKENLKKQTGNIVLPGAPLAMAGNVIELDSGFGRWAGRYLIQSSRHHFTRDGFTSNIEIALVGGEGGGGRSTSGSASAAKVEPRAQGRYAPGGQ